MTFGHRQGLRPTDYQQRPFNKDRLMLLNRDRAMNMAMAILDRTQQETDPEVAFAGQAIMFAAWCKRLNMDPHEAHTIALKMLAPEQFRQKGNIIGEVIRDFAGIRLVGDRRVDPA